VYLEIESNCEVITLVLIIKKNQLMLEITWFLDFAHNSGILNSRKHNVSEGTHQTGVSLLSSEDGIRSNFRTMNKFQKPSNECFAPS
jgi:hypothetical protein